MLGTTVLDHSKQAPLALTTAMASWHSLEHIEDCWKTVPGDKRTL